VRAIGQQSRPIVLRASRYAPRAAARSAKVPKAVGASGAPQGSRTLQFIRSPTRRAGSAPLKRRAWDQEAPTRDEPLTPGTRRPLRRGAACGAERAASGRPYQRSIQPYVMPTCSQCFHGGKRHDWTSPPCSAPNCFCIREHWWRVRGRCLVPGCACSHYLVLGRPKPVNPYIGKARR